MSEIADELLARWIQRDGRYAASRRTLSDEAIAAVRSWRRHELDDLDAKDRGLLAREVLLWTPPVRLR